jgi:rhodanese-related sulfurtransferase
VPAEDVPRLGVDAAHAEVLAGKAVLVDVRSAEAYQRSRAKGAILLPLEQIESSPQGTAGGLPAGLRPVLYCT